MNECFKLTCVCEENIELERQLRRKEAQLAEAEGQLRQKVNNTGSMMASLLARCFYF